MNKRAEYTSPYYKFRNRQTNMEYLRILAMFMIVLSHYNFFCDYPDNIVFNDPITSLLKILGRIGTNCFVLLAGYFGITSCFKLSSLLKLWFVTLFYSVVFLFVFKIILNEPFELKETITYFLPISFEKYWFVSCYLSLYLFSPFLIKAIKNLTRKQHLYFLLLFFIWWTVFPSFLIYPSYARGTGMSYNLFSWFIFLFIVGSYMRLYITADKVNVFKYLAIFGMSLALCLVYVSIISKTATEIDFYMDRNNFFIFIASLCLFCVFLKIKPFQSRFINSISVCMIGVYLVHMHPMVLNFIRKYLSISVSDQFFTFKVFLVALIIFFACLFIEFLRRKISQPFSRYMISTLQPIDEKIKKIIDEKSA